MPYSKERQQERYNHWYSQRVNEGKLWEGAGLLDHIKDDYHATMVAVVLENQRLINESKTSGTAFNRISIPLVLRLFHDSPFVKWVGFQASLSPNNTVWIRRDDTYLDDTPYTSNSRRLKTEWPTQELLRVDHGHNLKLDHEVEVTLNLYCQLSDEICREITGDLCEHAPRFIEIIHENDNQSKVIEQIFEQASKSIKLKTDHEPNWLVTSPEFIQLLESHSSFSFQRLPNEYSEAGVYLAGKIGDKDVYCDTKFVNNQVLFGCRHGWEDAGYYYMPYIPFSDLSTTVDPHSFNPHTRIITRYGKLMPRDGHEYYRLVQIDNLDFNKKFKNEVTITELIEESEEEDVSAQEWNISSEDREK